MDVATWKVSMKTVYQHAEHRLRVCGDVSLVENSWKMTTSTVPDQVVSLSATPTVPFRLAVVCLSLPRRALD